MCMKEFETAFHSVRSLVNWNLQRYHNTTVKNMAWNVHGATNIMNSTSAHQLRMAAAAGIPSEDNHVLYGTLHLEAMDNIKDPYALSAVLCNTGCVMYDTKTVGRSPWKVPGEISLCNSGRIVQCQFYAPVNLFPSLKKEIDETIICAKLRDEVFLIESEITYMNPESEGWQKCTLGT